MKDKMLEESLNNFYRTFLIWVIRCYPILFCLAILVHQCEVIHSVGTGDIIEYYDGDTLEYVQYATPFSDKYLTVFFNAKLFNAILFYVLSKVFLFCIYHRVFVIEMFIYAILDIVFNKVLRNKLTPLQIVITNGYTCSIFQVAKITKKGVWLYSLFVKTIFRLIIDEVCIISTRYSVSFS